MKKMIWSIMICSLSLNILEAKDIYVAKNGKDSNTGTEASPYLTISKAAQVAVAGDIVYVKEGVYRETVSPSKAGTAGNPITFKAYGDDEVTISATEELSGWTQHSGDIYKASVTMNRGLRNMIYFDGKAMDLARWPNNTDDNRHTIDAHPDVTGGSASTINTSGVPNVDWDGGLVWYLGAHSGASWTRELTSVTSSKVSFTAVDITKWPFKPHNPTVFRNHNYGRFYLLNAMGALDYEREWYYKNGTVYFQAPGNANPSTGLVEYAAREYTINITKDYIEFDGISAFGGEVMIGGQYAVIKNGRFKHCLETVDLLTNKSAQISNGSITVRSKHATIENNIIEYGSSNGIMARNTSNYVTIKNNIIRHFNTIGNHSSLIRSTSRNAKVLNNTCYSTGRDGMYINSYDCEVAYNDVYEVMKINNDGGLFYVVGNDDSRNTEVHHNWFHDSFGPEYADGRAAGIYLDNDSKGYTVHHNVVWNITWTGIQTNWDVWDNNIYNNSIWNVSDAMGAWLPKRSGYQTTIQRTKIYNNYASKEEWLGTDEKNNIISAESPFQSIEDHDFMPRAGASNIIDKGLVIPGITDNVTDGKPDIGAYEFGGESWAPGANIAWTCTTVWFLDKDGDGVGDSNNSIESCAGQPDGYVAISGDLCLDDPNKTNPGHCGCGVKEQECTEAIDFAQNITTVPGIKNIPVDLEYGVDEDRDLLLVLLDGNGGWVGNTTETVKEGSGIQRITIKMGVAPTPGPSYRLDAYILPVNGDVTQSLATATRNVSVNEPGVEDCNGDVDGIAMVDGCGRCSGGNTEFIPKDDDCDSDSVSVIKENDNVSGIKENDDWLVYPNPTTGSVYLQQPKKWEIFTQVGEFLKKGEGQTISLEELPEGIYILYSGTKYTKVIKE
ncbi:right-handed parallel beta-helix repeat-containing protein [Reichenbachiella versicolor]|uniref:right-handed parallel beta-helix repeat-containing protein n=1 Tax=Reichenbachiella versicolor TaxID=1821036 RepID=UPI0013A543E8|nr:right-handed parallel beta-helix repeat-containing protein [Reichenbachiella versicolor]